MPTIIDSFLVTFGMDPSGIVHGVATADVELAKLKTAAEQAKQALVMAKMKGPKLPTEELDKLKLAAKQTAVEFTAAQKKLREESRKTTKQMKEDGEKAGEFYSSLAEKAAAFFAVLVGGRELKEFFKHTQETQISLLHLSEVTGKEVEELAAWSGAARLAGGSAEAFQGSLKGLSGMLVDVEKNLPRAKRALKVLQAAGVKGIAMGKHSDLFEVMDQLADRMDKNKAGAMSGMEAMRLGSRMGMDEHTIYLFRMGVERMRELREEATALGVPTKEQAEASHELEESQVRLSLAGESLGRNIITMIMPAVKYLTDKFAQLTIWANENPDTVRKVFIGIAGGIAAASIAAAIATPAVFTFTAPLLLAAAAGVALGVVLYELTKDFDQVGEDGVSTWKRLEMQTAEAVGVIHGLGLNMLDKLVQIFNIMEGAYDGDIKKMRTSWGFLMEDMGQDFENTKTLGAGFFGWLENRLQTLWDWSGQHPILATLLPIGMIHHISKGWEWLIGLLVDGWGKFKSYAIIAIDLVIEKLQALGNALAKIAAALRIPMAASLVVATGAAQETQHAKTLKDMGVQTGSMARQDEIFAHQAALRNSLGYRPSATMAMQPSHTNNSRSSSTTKETVINGGLHLTLPNATDAAGIQHDLPGALRDTNLVNMAEDGGD